MPFCSKCGIQIQDGAKFCDGCGAPVYVNTNIPNNSQLYQTQEARKSSLEEMDRMINYFSQKQAQYDEYDDCVEQIAYYSKPSTVVRINEQMQWKGSTGLMFLFLSIPSFLFGVIGFPALLVLSINEGATFG